MCRCRHVSERLYFMYRHHCPLCFLADGVYPAVRHALHSFTVLSMLQCNTRLYSSFQQVESLEFGTCENEEGAAHFRSMKAS